MKDIYDFNVATITRNEQSMSIYKDKVLLIVNVASECGFTPQYEGLEKLYKRYKDQGFEILAFPCNQFGEQEPGPYSIVARPRGIHRPEPWPFARRRPCCAALVVMWPSFIARWMVVFLFIILTLVSRSIYRP